jgi:hypothetical protein
MTNEYIQITGTTSEGLVPNDYGCSLLHIAWLTEGLRQHLLFAFVELFPSELPEPSPIPLRELILNESTNDKISYCQFLLPYDEAIAWYESCLQGNLIIPLADNILFEISQHNFKQDVEWPGLLATNNLNFLGSTWGTVRSHHLLYDREKLNIRRVTDDPKAMRWVSDCFLLEFLDHPDYFGAIYFVAPDPVFRNVGCTLGVGESEFVDFEFVTRKGADFEGIQLIVNEHRGGDLEKKHTVPVLKNYVRINSGNKVDRISYQVICAKRGILLDSPPAGFIRNISINIEVDSARKTKEIKALANRSGQRWFYGNEREVEKFIKEEIAKAKKRVCIIEPELISTYMTKFALAVTRSEVSFSLVFGEEACSVEDIILGDIPKLIEQVTELAQKHKKKLNAFVMKLDGRIFYDRLFVVDDDVWLFGNPLNNMSNGMMVKLPHSQSVIRELDSCFRESKFVDLAKWVEQFQADGDASS